MKKKIQFMQEGFDGIKIIKLLGREKFFFNKYFTKLLPMNPEPPVTTNFMIRYPHLWQNIFRLIVF